MSNFLYIKKRKQEKLLVICILPITYYPSRVAQANIRIHKAQAFLLPQVVILYLVLQLILFHLVLCVLTPFFSGSWWCVYANKCTLGFPA
jgi:hypothetical protein